MSTRPDAALRKLRAWHAGAPLPVGRTLPWPRAEDDDRLVVAFVRMAGETTPWGIAYGPPGRAPARITIPEPRDHASLARLCLPFAEALLAHLPHPASLPDLASSEELDADDADEPEGARVPAELGAIARRRQLWLPGPTHVDMLHHLDFRFTVGRLPEGVEGADAELLRALGRVAGWLFRESTRPGQTRVFDATARLRDAFAFPADDAHQAHLGFLLAWLSPASPGAGPDRTARVAAARAAERDSVGITMDPALERYALAPLLERWREERSGPAGPALEAKIRAVLEGELERRWHLAERALRALDADPRPPNPELGKILDLAEREFVRECWRSEQKALAAREGIAAQRPAHPETDRHPPAAAARFFAHQHAAELVASELVHGDDELRRAAVLAGDAVLGRIEAVADEGPGRAKKPVWRVVSAASSPLRLREGSEVCVAGQRKRTGRIRSMAVRGEIRELVLEITAGLTERALPGVPPADSQDLVGVEVALVPTSPVGLSQKKAFRVWSADGPGAWLTHAAPGPLRPLASSRPPGGAELLELVEKLGG